MKKRPPKRVYVTLNADDGTPSGVTVLKTEAIRWVRNSGDELGPFEYLAVAKKTAPPKRSKT